MHEFKVNDFLSLKLENEETIIYVNNEPFKQCKHLLLNFYIDELKTLDEIESIDEAADRLDGNVEVNELKIPIEVEFWGHCSNIQLWYEHDYNTRLLHSNLAFPLLKKLSDVGDPIAKKVFKEEIAKRFSSGYLNVMKFLYKEGYLEYLEKEERESIFSRNLRVKLDDLIEREDIIDDSELLEVLQKQFPRLDEIEFGLSGRPPRLVSLSINRNVSNPIRKVDEIKGFFKISNLDRLFLFNFEMEDLSFLSHFKDLEELVLRSNRISEIKGFDDLSKLKKLNLGRNSIKKIKGLSNLINLEELQLFRNQISEIKGIENLKNLKILNLEYNKIEEIGGLEALHNLKELNLKHNQILKLRGLENLINLEDLDLTFNKIEEINGLENLKNLEKLWLGFNKITEIKGLLNQKCLKMLKLNDNQIEELKGLENLDDIDFISLKRNLISDEFLKTFSNSKDLVKFCKKKAH